MFPANPFPAFDSSAREQHDAEFWDDYPSQRRNAVVIIGGLMLIAFGGTTAILWGLL